MQQRLAAVGEMAAGIAHEIRNPLASMSGSIQILRQELPLTRRAGAADGHRAARVGAAERHDPQRSWPTRGRSGSRSRDIDVRRVVNDTALLLRNSAEVADGHASTVDVPAEPVVVRRRRRRRSGRSSGTWRPTGCARCRTAAGCGSSCDGGRATPDARRRGRHQRARRGRRHPARGARRHLPAVPRRVRQRHRPGPGHRPPHRQRLRRRGSRQLEARGGHDASRCDCPWRTNRQPTSRRPTTCD